MTGCTAAAIAGEPAVRIDSERMKRIPVNHHLVRFASQLPLTLLCKVVSNGMQRPASSVGTELLEHRAQLSHQLVRAGDGLPIWVSERLDVSLDLHLLGVLCKLFRLRSSQRFLTPASGAAVCESDPVHHG